IMLDRDDGLRVIEARPGSPAAAAGLQAGDELAAAGGRKLFGQADFRGVLHRASRGAGNIELYYLREGKPNAAKLAVSDHWRRTVLDWRMSVSQGNIGAEPGFWPLPASSKDRQKLGIPRGKLLAKAYAPFG